MTVEQLILELQDMPQDAEITANVRGTTTEFSILEALTNGDFTEVYLIIQQ
jgi:hypothetical protein